MFLKNNTALHILKVFGIHALFLVMYICCFIWIYTGVQKESLDVNVETKSEVVSVPAQDVRVNNRDDAVRSYMKAAQVLAEIYKFQNDGSYDGLCEGSTDFYTLEGERGGILKYVKMAGATDVFCHTGGTQYMIEVQMPESKQFVCVDASLELIELEYSREKEQTCQ